MGAADFIVELLQQVGRLVDVEFSGAVQVGAVKLYVTVNVRPVNVGADYKLMLPLCQLHCQLIGDLVRFLRRDLSGLEGLNDAVHDNVPLFWLAPPGELVVKALADLKFFGGGFRRTHIGGDQVPVQRLFRFLVVVVPFLHGLLPRPVPHGLSGEDIGN